MRISDWSSDVCSSDLRVHTARSAAEAASGRFDHVVGPDALLLEIARSTLVDGKAVDQVFGAEIEPDILKLDAQRPNVLRMVEDRLHHRIADLRIEIRHGGEHAGDRGGAGLLVDARDLAAWHNTARNDG